MTDTDALFERALDVLLETGRVSLHHIQVECEALSGLTLSDVNILASIRRNELNVRKGVDFWTVFDRAFEVLQTKEFTADEDFAFVNLQKAFKRFEDQNLQKKLLGLQSHEKEDEVNVWIAENIIAPLLGDRGQCLLNSSHARALEKLQKMDCGKQLFLENLGIGHQKAWYGEPDIMAVPSVPSDSSSVVVILGVQGHSSHEEEIEEECDSKGSPGNNVMIGKRNEGNSLEGYYYKQAIATAISFSFSYSERHVNLSSFIPTLQISPEGFDLFMYDCSNDYLVARLFGWSNVTFMYLWVILHYRLFQKCDVQELGLACSGYKKKSESGNGFTKVDGLLYKDNIHKLPRNSQVYERLHIEIEDTGNVHKRARLRTL